VAAVDQRNLIRRLPSLIWPPKWRMTVERMSGNLLRSAHDMPARMVYTALMRTAKLSKRSPRWVNKRFSLEMKKE
jgi:hypothetical protein